MVARHQAGPADIYHVGLEAGGSIWAPLNTSAEIRSKYVNNNINNNNHYGGRVDALYMRTNK